MFQRTAGIVAGLLVLCLSGPGYAYETDTDLVETKIDSTKALLESEGNRHIHGAYTSPQAREPSERDSGRKEALLFINNANFRFVSEIGFYVPKLSVALIPNDPGAPVIFDDPTSFSLHPLNGELILSGKALSALMNDKVFDFKGAPLRRLKLSTEDGVLVIKGEMDRRKWVPFVMRGGLDLKEGHVLVFTPNFVSVGGQEATNVLVAANVTLDELLTINTTGAVLKGSQLMLDTRLLFPPPKLNITIAGARLEKRGLVLSFNEDLDPAFPRPIVERNSNMMIRGGDVKFLRAMAVNALVQIVSDDEAADLDFNLYEYRRQLTAGFLKLGEDGSILVHLRNYNALAGDGR